MLGPDTPNYLGIGDHVARTIAANGIRLVLDAHRTTETPTLKSGKPGKTKVSYGEPEDALKWLWKFVVCRAPGYAEWFSAAARVVAAQAVGRRGRARHKQRLGIFGRTDERCRGAALIE